VVEIRSLDCVSKAISDRIAYLKGLANGTDPVGKYEYSEKGFSGKMDVTEVSGCEVKNQLGCLAVWVLKIRIFTINKSNDNDCDVEAVENSSARVSSRSVIDALFLTKGDDEAKTKNLSVRFDQNGATVQLEGGDLVGLCGMNGNFTGKWRKTGG
jgi:hypothetical protein